MVLPRSNGPQPFGGGKPGRDAKSVVPRLRPGVLRARRLWPAATGLFWLRVRCCAERQRESSPRVPRRARRSFAPPRTAGEGSRPRRRRLSRATREMGRTAGGGERGHATGASPTATRLADIPPAAPRRARSRAVCARSQIRRRPWLCGSETGTPRRLSDVRPLIKEKNGPYGDVPFTQNVANEPGA